MSQGPKKDDTPAAAVDLPARVEPAGGSAGGGATSAARVAPPPLPKAAGGATGSTVPASPLPTFLVPAGRAKEAGSSAAAAPASTLPIQAPVAQVVPGPASKVPPLPGGSAAPVSSAKPASKAAPGAATSLPPKLPTSGPAGVKAGAEADLKAAPKSDGHPKAPPAVSEPPAEAETGRGTGSSRNSRRRAAGPSRQTIAANDDVPSIGGLIYALQQKPSQRPMSIAAIASAVWAVLGILLGWAMLAPELARAPTFMEMLSRPTAITLAATIFIPIALFWFLALLLWRAQELRLMSSAMTEVAIRLAEPDRMAEQQIASVGQAVRRQVSFMNEAVSRALGRAGELEALVHSEVAALERAYSENEHRIRGLLGELSGERNALLQTSERVNRALKEIGTEIPSLVDKLGQQQQKLAGFIEGAGQNLVALETSLASTAENVSNKLGSQTAKIEHVFEDFTTTLAVALEARTENLRLSFEKMSVEMSEGSKRIETALDGHAERLAITFDERGRKIDEGIGVRTENLQAVFEQFAGALEATMASRQEAIDRQLVERTKVLDEAFADRLKLFDESILRSTLAIDGAVADKALALTEALEGHAAQIGNVLGNQAEAFDGQVLEGVQAVRRASEAVTRQSMAAIEGMANQADMLKHVSEGLLSQINSVTGRFETQGKVIMTAAHALESANTRIDRTLQARQDNLSQTLEQIAGKTGDIDRVVRGYSSQLEGSFAEAETRAKQVGEQLTRGAKEQARLALTEMERLRTSAGNETDRALDELRAKFSTVSREVNEHIGTLSSRFNATSEEMRLRARAALSDLEAEQGRLRDQLERLPDTTRSSTEGMKRVLQEQLRALQQLSTLTIRESSRRDISPPAQLPPPAGHQGGHAGGPGPGHAHQPQPSARQPSPEAAVRGASGAAGRGEGWKLGDLLARASEEEAERATAAAVQSAPPDPGINVPGIARSLDATTAAAIWSRFRAGQRGIMVRSIYSNEGRAIFDDVQRRYRTEGPFKATVDRYLLDFEHVLREADQQDASGRLTQSYVVSDGGRVYLFLAHAAARLA